MSSTKVEIRDNRELRRVEALDPDGEVAGFADYQIGVDGSTFEFTHTEVDDRFEGQGVGTRLAAGVMDFVRGEGAKIVPTCSFLRSYMDEHEETSDLRAEPEPEESDDSADSEQSGDRDEESGDEDSGDEDSGDEDSGDSDDADVDSPEAGPADAKAAGSAGAAEESEDRQS